MSPRSEDVTQNILRPRPDCTDEERRVKSLAPGFCSPTNFAPELSRLEKQQFDEEERWGKAFALGSTKATNVDGKIAAAATKPPLALIPLNALQGVARVFEYGQKKYAPGNFFSAELSDGAAERYLSGVLRHLLAVQEANGLHTADSLGALDEESGLPHLDHAICGLIMLRAIASKVTLKSDPGQSKDPKKEI